MLAGVKDWRGSLLKFRWQTVRALAPRRLVLARGVRFTLQCENWITHYRWQTYTEKEPETLDWIDRWIRDGDTICDIGANIGVYALYAALRHPRARIIAFEPEYANLHLLRDNVMANRLQDRLEIYAVALSNRSGVSRLYLQDLAPGSALHTESPERLDATLTGHPVVWQEGVCTLTLDEFCQETGLTPQGIKLDVDGTEERVLEGAQRTLSALSLRSVLVELPTDCQAREACRERLERAGLRRHWSDPQGRSDNEIWVRRA